MAQGLRTEISLSQIRYFVRAAELGSMSRAAESLFVAQSAVSTSVANLERALGATLFVRQRAKGLALTAAGEQFLASSRLVLRALETAVQEVDARSLTGEFTAGCFPTLVPFWMPSVCEAIAAAHPGLQANIEEAQVDDLLDALRTGRLEVALAYRFDATPREVQAVHIGSVDMHAIVGPAHPFADRDETSIDKLAAISPYVMLDLRGSDAYFSSAIATATAPVRIAHRLGNYEAVRSMVARSDAFSLINQVPMHDRTYDGGTVRRLRLVDAPPPLEIVCLHRADQPLTRKARAFVDACREVAPGMLAAGDAMRGA